MKIYTRTGDAGMTGLFGGDRVPKQHPRIEAYGTVDETNSVIGVARAATALEADLSLVHDMLEQVQQTLFVLGADLATPSPSRVDIERIGPADVKWLEKAIDRLDSDLPALRRFILPGGSSAGAYLHVARTVARRAERLVAALEERNAASSTCLVYLNRLSDFLFVAARWVNARLGVPEAEWAGRSGGS